MARRTDQPLPSFAQMSAEEESFFNSRGGEDGTPVQVQDDAPAPPRDELPPEPTELERGRLDPTPPPLAAEPEDLPSEADLGLGEPVEAEQGRAEPPRRAPIPALQAERDRRQAAEARMQEMESRLRQHEEYRARIDERLRVFNEQQQMARQRQQEQARPDPEVDPEGFRAWVDQQRETRIAQLEERLARAEQGGQQSQLHTQVASMTQAYATRVPDYFDTMTALRASLVSEYQLAGLSDPNEIQAEINAWSERIIHQSMQRGVNPADSLYRIAKTRLGGRPAPAAPADPNRRVAPPTTRDRVASIARGQRATGSLSRGGSRESADGLTLDRLLNASPVEFARYMAEQPTLVASLMGR